MKKSPKNKGKRVLAVILGIIWGILVVIAAYDVVEIYTYNSSYYMGADYTARYVLAKDYGRIYQRMENDLTSGLNTEVHTEYAEVAAIHDFIEAGAQYKMYKDNGMTERANMYKAKMEEAKSRLGGFTFTVKDMEEMLGIK